MKKTTPILTLASLLTFGPAFIPPSSAQSAAPGIVAAQWGRRAVPRARVEQTYSQGYRIGVREGERDARDRRRRDYRQHSEYRRGGGHSRDGNALQDAYRRGFAEGYVQGYGRARGSWGRPDARGYPGRGYPSYPSYPDRGGSRGGYGYPGDPGGYGNRGGYGYSQASQRGFEHGHKEGRDDGRDNDRYDPRRHKKYREGDDGYNSRYGSRDQYKVEYRQAFQQGYDQGYREGQYR